MKRSPCIAPFIMVLVMCVFLATGVELAEAADSGPQVDGDFPGGNILVQRIEGDAIHLRPDLRDTQGWWFYWNFRTHGAAGRTLTFRFNEPSPIGTRGPAKSDDGGKTWTYLGNGLVKDSSFTYTFPVNAREVRFCFTIPYLQSDINRFLEKHKQRHLKVEELCKSRGGRMIERILVGDFSREPKYRVLLTARHHACESIADFVLEGFLAAALDDTELGRWFRENVDVLAVPFVDKDGVEEGDQGKNRRPHDHNRDYQDESIYPSVAAIRRFVPAWSKGRLDVALDLHCPWIRGQHNEVIYMVGSPDPVIWKRQVAFGKILEEVSQGPLPYHASDNLPYGQSWNTDSNYKGHTSCSRWVSRLEGIGLASSLEIPYANVADQTVDADKARAFGRDLAHAVRQYLIRQTKQ